MKRYIVTVTSRIAVQINDEKNENESVAFVAACQLTNDDTIQTAVIDQQQEKIVESRAAGNDFDDFADSLI